MADALSRLGIVDDVDKSSEQPSTEEMADLYAGEEIEFPSNTFPLSRAYIAQEQRADAALQKLYHSSEHYSRKTFPFGDDSHDLIVFQGTKIVIPAKLQKRAVEWYHTQLLHPGETRTELTIAQHYHWKGMRATIKDVCGRCPTCQLTKRRLRKVGHLPEKEAETIPWETLCIDLIGPYTIGKGKNQLTLHCLTMIDPATGWFEIVEIKDKKADLIANLIEMHWLMRYPWPTEVVMDRGREFMAEVPTMLKDEYGIKRKPITTRNPQANAMVERAHQTMGNLIRTQQVRGKHELPEWNPWGGILAAIGFAMRSTVHTTTQATPAQLVFSRDAMHNIRFEADWQFIKDRKQHLIRQNNRRENKKRIPHTYQIGDTVAVKADPNRKYDGDQYNGPFVIRRINDNGTVRLEQNTPRGGVTHQDWNIRNIVPFKA